MAPFLVPALATPLLKVPILFSTAICTYYGFTPPIPQPEKREEQRFTVTVSDWMTRTPYIQMPASWILKVCLFASALAHMPQIELFSAHTSHVPLSRV